jgi:2,5-diketo-D-gluconate reductase B
VPADEEMVKGSRLPAPGNGFHRPALLKKPPDNLRQDNNTLMKEGNMIPKIGLGTFRFDDSQAAEAVRTALELGYRHIDTAQMYDNEQGVGEGIRAVNVPREEIFVTTKVWHENLRRGDLLNSLKESLQRLRLDYVDMALIHWPSPDHEVPMKEYMSALYEAKKQGLTHHIGVSNFTEALMQEALSLPEGKEIETNQVEVHPWLANRELVDYCQQHNVPVTAYMPLAKARVMDEPVLKEVADKHQSNPAQVTLAWLLARDLIVIPASTNPEHQKINFHARDLRLDEEDMKRIDSLDEGYRLIDPSFAPDWEAKAA